jgi:HD-GYP domain-containing protein (c-di-GMP phosphodiesterase class II)
MGADEGRADAIRTLDRELFRDYLDELEERAPRIERYVGMLRAAPDDLELVAGLFRAFHNLKGDAALCRYPFGVEVAHQLETLLMRVREGRLRFTAMLAEAMLLALDRLERAAQAHYDREPVVGLRLPVLLEELRAMAEARAEAVEDAAARMIERVSGFRPAQAGREAPAAPTPASRGADLTFFSGLALQLEQRSPLFQGRTARVLHLARSINEVAGRPVDPLQLEAAVYMHDVGMMFLAEPVWLKPGRLSPADLAELRRHPAYAAGLLERMSGWDEAARIVAQHHEMPSGQGYPRALAGDAICPGAKLMAIVDAFEAVTLKQTHRGQSRSMLRAAAEVNAAEQQFAAEWIAPFNQVVRGLLEA